MFLIFSFPPCLLLFSYLICWLLNVLQCHFWHPSKIYRSFLASKLGINKGTAGQLYKQLGGSFEAAGKFSSQKFLPWSRLFWAYTELLFFFEALDGIGRKWEGSAYGAWRYTFPPRMLMTPSLRLNWTKLTYQYSIKSSITRKHTIPCIYSRDTMYNKSNWLCNYK